MELGANNAAATPSPPQTPQQPTARRPRVSRACVACQQKKQKCDGGSPACRNCIKANRTCISQDPSTNRRYPRGYVNSLEMHNASLGQHIAFLESALKERHPDMDVDDLTGQTILYEGAAQRLQRSSLTVPLQGRIAAPDRHTGNRLDDTSDLDMLCYWAAGGDPHYFGASSDLSFTKVFSASLRGVQSQGPGLTMGGVADSSRLTRQVSKPKQLPERSALVRLTEAYFDQVHPQFPFLHRPTYLQWQDGLLRAREKGEDLDAAHLFFVYIIAAVGARTLANDGDRLAEGLYASAETLFEHVVRLNSLESIQAILCCAMYSIRSPIGVSVWTLSGLALRQCIELGLHRKIPWSKVEPNTLKTQMRRRVFWCSYNLDRAVAITLGRPVGINDSDIDVEYPLDLKDEDITTSGLLAEPRTSNLDPATTMSSAIHTIRARQIWGRIQSLMYPQVAADLSPEVRSMFIESFQKELKEWLDTAPEQLPANLEHNNAFGSRIWFELMYYHSILILFRQSLINSSNGHNPADETQVSAFYECARAGQQICHFYRQLYISHQLSDTWGALHVLFLGSITFLYCLWTSTRTRGMFRLDEVSATCSSCMVVLAVMAERCPVVRPYRDTFESLARATQTMLVEAQARSSPQTLPVLPGDNEQLSNDLVNMAELGMCSSIEALLGSMIQ